MKNKAFSLLKKFHVGVSASYVAFWAIVGTYSPAQCPDMIPCDLPEVSQIVLFFEMIMRTLVKVYHFVEIALYVSIVALIPFGVKWFIAELRGYKSSPDKFKVAAVATAHLVGVLLGVLIALLVIIGNV